MATQPDDRPNGTGRIDRIEALLERTAEQQRQNTQGLAETRRLIEGMAEQQRQNTQGLAETRRLIRDLAKVVEGIGEFVSTHVEDRSAHR